MEWVYFVCMLVNGFFCYWIGCRTAELENEFKPTQETWLELKKFQWTHKCNGMEDGRRE